MRQVGEARDRCALCGAPAVAGVCPRCRGGAARRGPLGRRRQGPGGLVGGTYRLIEEVGRSGDGTVFRAMDETLGRQVAVKFLLPELQADPAAAEHFQRESRTLSALNQRNVLAVYSTGRHRGADYIVTEFVTGITLSDAIAAKKSRGAFFPLHAALRIVRHLCDGLDAAHRLGVVHRDVKPDNVMLEDRTERVVIVDFGIGRRAAFGAVDLTALPGGTPAYMAPENLDGRPKTSDQARRADIYSLGVLAYELVTGELPFRAESWVSVLIEHVTADPPTPSSVRPGLPDGLDAVLLWPLARSPADRPATPLALRDALAPFEAGASPSSPAAAGDIRATGPHAGRDATEADARLRFVLVTPEPSLLEMVLTLAQAISPDASVLTSRSLGDALERARAWPTTAIVALARAADRQPLPRGTLPLADIAEAAAQKTPVILLVDDASSEERATLARSGAFRVLDRPIRRRDLEAALGAAARLTAT